MVEPRRQIEKAYEALRSGNAASAHLALRRLLKKDPANPEARLLMADALARQGQVIEAARGSRELLAETAFDDDPRLSRRLADVCMACELWFDAARLYDRLAESGTADESLHYRAGTACYRSGRLDDARSHFERCVALRPEHPAAYLQLGHIHRAFRDFDAAAERYSAYTARSEAEKAFGYWSLADLRAFTIDDGLTAEMQSYLDGRPEGSLEASLTRFALGVAAERGGNHEEALAQFRRANDVQARARPFRAQAFRRLTDGLLSAAPPAPGDAAPARSRPIFIVGLPRSGTTLVEQILAAHPQVAATDELPYMERIAMELERSGGYGRRLSGLGDDEAARFRQRYLDEAGQHFDGDTPCFIDKNPNNFLHIGLLRRLLPEAKIINLRRDLRDNAFSIYRQYFRSGHDYSASFDDITTYAQGYLELMSHWLFHYPDAIRRQSYEELVHDPSGQITGLLEFCGLENESACFEFHRSRQAVMTPSAGQVSQPMYDSSIGHWRHYEPWLGEVFAHLQALQEH